MLDDDDLIIVRGGRMASDSLRRALLASADRGVFELSTQCLPGSDEEAQDQVWDYWLHRYNSTCWTTPALLREAGLTPVHSPSEEHGPFHIDICHPASPSEVDVDMVVSDFQCAFFGPDRKRKVTNEWTSTDLRGLQQPREEG